MRFIEIRMSNGEIFTLPEEKAEAVIASEQQLVRIYDGDRWTGETINQAHIVCTKIDEAITKHWRVQNSMPKPKTKAVAPPKHISHHIKQTLNSYPQS